MDLSFLNKLRILGFVEGCSTLLLFGVAMPLKYVWDMPLAVRIVGSLHGALFIALCVMCAIAVKRVPIGVKLGAAGVVGAVVPFGPFIVDGYLKRRGEELASPGGPTRSQGSGLPSHGP